MINVNNGLIIATSLREGIACVENMLSNLPIFFILSPEEYKEAKIIRGKLTQICQVKSIVVCVIISEYIDDNEIKKTSCVLRHPSYFNRITIPCNYN